MRFHRLALGAAAVVALCTLQGASVPPSVPPHGEEGWVIAGSKPNQNRGFDFRFRSRSVFHYVPFRLDPCLRASPHALSISPSLYLSLSLPNQDPASAPRMPRL